MYEYLINNETVIFENETDMLAEGTEQEDDCMLHGDLRNGRCVLVREIDVGG